MKNLSLEKGEAFLSNSLTDIRYFLNFKCSFGYILTAKGETWFFTDSRYYLRAKKLKNCHVVCVGGNNVEDLFSNLFKELEIKKIAINENEVSLGFYKFLSSFSLPLVSVSKKINEIRKIKSEKEIKDIKRACKICDKAFKETLLMIKEGQTELQVMAILNHKLIELGGEDLAFDTIVAFGKNSAIPHHETGRTRLKQNTPILFDFGVKVNGLCSDVSRTVFFGEANGFFRKKYNMLLNCQKTLIKFANKDTTYSELFEKAKELLGLDQKFFTHSLGHGVGIEIHEEPYLNGKRGDKLEKNSVFTIEPGVYYENKFGIRIEDTCYFDGEKLIPLNKAVKKLIEIKNF